MKHTLQQQLRQYLPFFICFDRQKQTKGRRIKIVKLTKMARVVKQQNINWKKLSTACKFLTQMILILCASLS